ncbi:MAG: FAD:protein FMN transferase [Micropruina sp.]|nr:FAD:protein FMN transferase [Micropruina sp.]
MGTVVSLSGDLPERATSAVENAFADLDERFSLYRPESEASAIARGDLPLTRASQEMRGAYELAQSWRVATEGAFTPQRPDGVLDLSGVVKAMAIERAGTVLDEFGATHWSVNAGGDVLTRSAGDAAPWVIGIVDPSDRDALLTQCRLGPDARAVATSGIAERGEHIWRIGADDTFAQVSVVAPDIITADVLATAILAGGRHCLELACRTWSIEVIAVTRSGSIFATDAFRTTRPATR